MVKSKRFHVLTLFPDMFVSPFTDSIIGRACVEGLVDIKVYNLRDYASDHSNNVDDYAFGGGPGMVMKPEPIFKSIDVVRSQPSFSEDTPIILLSPQGRTLTQPDVEQFAKYNDLVLICGHYEGVDERVRQHLATDEVSVGDYVLTGGELAAMVMIDSVARLIPGVVGSPESIQGDSFTIGLLQHPQYTRPSKFRGWAVPEVLLSGDHAKIAQWRRQESLRNTFISRPDLLESASLSEDELNFIQGLYDDKDFQE